MPEVYSKGEPRTRTDLLARIMGASTIGKMLLTGDVRRTDIISVEESLRGAKQSVEDPHPNRSMRLNPILNEEF